MRYMTKQWYQTMQDSGLGVCLEADERAAVYSEELYQQIFTEKLERWLRDREEVCGYLSEPFDPQRERQSFAELCARELAQYQTRTPGDILSKVADVRMLALGLCTEEVWNALEDYRRSCQQTVERTMEEYRHEYKARGLAKVWTGDHSLHDSCVRSLRQEGEDLVLEFDREDEDWHTVSKIRFLDAGILRQEASVENAWWLYDELWPAADGYEVHVLLYRDDAPMELTIACSDVELQWIN